MGGSEGKVVYLHHSSAESKYYTLRCVLRTKWSFHSVLGIKSVFVVCCTQIQTFTVSIIQISLVITYLIPSVKPPPVQLIPPVAHFALHQPQQLHLRSLHPKKRGTCLKNNNFSSLHSSNKNLVIIEGKRNSGYLHRPYPYLYLGL